jgi:hypothetical protein
MIQAVPLAAIRIVLVEPSHPGNIGAVARAMKNMALADLVLVRPKAFPHPDATARASGADDLLARARVVDSVAEAVADCGLRRRHHLAAARSEFPRARPARGRAAHLRDERARPGRRPVWRGAHRPHQRRAGARAPADPHPGQPGISVAESRHGGAAHDYELFRAAGSPASARPLSESTVPLAPGADMERFYAHLQQVMDEVEFKDRNHRRHAPHDAPATSVPALRDGPERGQHPARHPDVGAAEASRFGRVG